MVELPEEDKAEFAATSLQSSYRAKNARSKVDRKKFSLEQSKLEKSVEDMGISMAASPEDSIFALMQVGAARRAGWVGTRVARAGRKPARLAHATVHARHRPPRHVVRPRHTVHPPSRSPPPVTRSPPGRWPRMCSGGSR